MALSAPPTGALARHTLVVLWLRDAQHLAGDPGSLLEGVNPDRYRHDVDQGREKRDRNPSASSSCTTIEY
jgi:hypothetical protein